VHDLGGPEARGVFPAAVRGEKAAHETGPQPAPSVAAPFGQELVA
jgi:hypothetical protein